MSVLDTALPHQRIAFRIPRRLPTGILPDALRDAGYWFLDMLHKHYLRWQSDDNRFTRLKAAYLHRVIPWRKWPLLRDRLELSGIVQRDPSYSVGKKSMGYRLSPSCVPSHRVECQDAVVARKIRTIRQEARDRLLPVHRWLEPPLDRLQLDTPRAKRIVATLVPDEECPLTVGEYRTLLTEQIDRLNDRERYLKVDAYGRVHTPVTNLPKPLRCCLSIDGQKLVGLDLANSQPLFAGLVALEYANASRRQKQKIRTQKFDNRSSVQYSRKMSPLAKRENPLFYRLNSTSVNRNTGGLVGSSVSRPGAAIYLRLCEAGRLYESLVSDGFSREDVKKKLFVVFFGKPHWKSPISKAFARRFPDVWNVLRELRRKDYQRAAWTMQHRESSLFIGNACRRIMQERPELPVLTIHDSLLTTPQHVEYVESVLMEAFGDIGLQPTLKRE